MTMSMKLWRSILTSLLCLAFVSTGPVAKALSLPLAVSAGIAASGATPESAKAGTGIAAKTAISARSDRRCQRIGAAGSPCGVDIGLSVRLHDSHPGGASRAVAPSSSRAAAGFTPAQITGPPRSC